MKTTVEEEYEKIESRKVLFDTFQQKVSRATFTVTKLTFFFSRSVAVLWGGKPEGLERQYQLKHGGFFTGEELRYPW